MSARRRLLCQARSDDEVVVADDETRKERDEKGEVELRLGLGGNLAEAVLEVPGGAWRWR